MDHYLQQPVTQSEPSREDIARWKSANSTGSFDCNICLDSVEDPVVTFCGHLYCWPCIYRWIHSQDHSSENPEQELQCPVCKAQVSEDTLIPLYGRGQSGKSSDGKGARHGPVVPQRPSGPGCGVRALIAATSSSSHSSQHHHQHVHPYYSLGNYAPSPGLGFAGTTTFHPMIGMFGEMIYARIFGNSETTLYAYPNTYSVATTSGRARRHVMQANKSLSRMSFFLCCCIILCLLLF